MTEKEYIERETLQNKIKEICKDYGIAYGKHYGGFAEKIANVTNMVSAADVQEVRHGKWLINKNMRECTECGYFYYSNNVNTNYCCNCGTKMDKE